MTTENTTKVETVQATDSVKEVSLEDVYREAGITEPQVQTPAAKVEPAIKEVSIEDIPDAYDEKHKDFLKELVTKQAALEANQQASMQKESQRESAIAQAKLEEEIKEATVFLKESAGLDHVPLGDEAKNTLARIELELRAASDPKFKALWDARNSSPAAKTALNKALTVISKDIARKFEAKVDTKLAENRKALKAAHQSSATTDEDTGKSPLEGLNGVEFDKAWARMSRVNN